jgi:transcriptional regulator with AAA-type ATPase domain
MIYSEQLTILLNELRPFSILLLGERGTGKTSSVKSIADDSHIKMEIASCASYPDDTMAESILFGHQKGAFTGAIEKQEGLFKRADGGVLFFDEVHTLSYRVQEKLMQSLQTESSGKNQGKFRIQPLGGRSAEYVMVQPVFASNLNLLALKEKLLPDFYDRISQVVIELPPLRKAAPGKKGLEVFKTTWTNMAFEKHSGLPELPEFKKWMRQQHFPGNYRDIDTIAILWNKARQIFKNDDKLSFEFVKEQFEKYHSDGITIAEGEIPFFRKGLTKKQMEKEFRNALYEWADKNYNSLKEAGNVLEFSRMDKLKKAK